MSKPSHNYKHPNRPFSPAAHTLMVAEGVRPYRQQLRLAGWKIEWLEFSCWGNAPVDSQGIISRRVRRAMARAKWRRIWKASRAKITLDTDQRDKV